MTTSNCEAEGFTNIKQEATVVHTVSTIEPSARDPGANVDTNGDTPTTLDGNESINNRGSLSPNADNSSVTTVGSARTNLGTDVVSGNAPAGKGAAIKKHHLTNDTNDTDKGDAVKDENDLVEERAVDKKDAGLGSMSAVEETATNDGDAAVKDESSSETKHVRDALCKAQPNCVAGSGDHRKVVSHIFGRNKRCTRKLPDDAWILWCRKHYQRKRYRAEDDGIWHLRQLALVREQLNEFERLANVESWFVTLRKGEQATLDAENARLAATLTLPAAVTAIANLPGTAASAGPTSNAADSANNPSTKNADATDTANTPNTTNAKVKVEDNPNAAFTPLSANANTSNSSKNQTNQTTNEPEIIDSDTEDEDSTLQTPPPPLWERFLVPHLGPTKTYAQVRALLNLIDAEFRTPAFQARDKEDKVFPGIEFLPNFPGDKAKPSHVKTSEGSKKRKSTGDDAGANKRRRSLRNGGSAAGVA